MDLSLETVSSLGLFPTGSRDAPPEMMEVRKKVKYYPSNGYLFTPRTMSYFDTDAIDRDCPFEARRNRW